MKAESSMTKIIILLLSAQHLVKLDMFELLVSIVPTVLRVPSVPTISTV